MKLSDLKIGDILKGKMSGILYEVISIGVDSFDVKLPSGGISTEQEKDLKLYMIQSSVANAPMPAAKFKVGDQCVIIGNIGDGCVKHFYDLNDIVFILDTCEYPKMYCKRTMPGKSNMTQDVDISQLALVGSHARLDNAGKIGSPPLADGGIVQKSRLNSAGDVVWVTALECGHTNTKVCIHVWKTYDSGFTAYQFCEKCDEKREIQ